MENLSTFKLAAVNETLASMPTPLTVDVREDASTDARGQALAVKPLDEDADVKFIPVIHTAELDDGTPSDIARKISQVYTAELDNLDFDADMARSKMYIKSRVLPRLMDKDKAEEAKKTGLITVPFLDLYVYFAVTISENPQEGELISYCIDQRIIDESGLEIDEIMQAAKENASKDITVESIEDVLGLSDDSIQNTFYVASNHSRHYGAYMLLLDDFLKEQESRLNGFHIIPSSCHELLLIPDSLGIKTEELYSMLDDVNSTIVQPKDILSYTVYGYKDGQLTIAEK